MRKYWIILCFLLGVSMVLGGCQERERNEVSMLQYEDRSKEKQEDAIVILLTHTEPENSLTHVTAQFFEKYLENISDGAMTVSVYGNNTLGNLGEGLTSVSRGTVQVRLGTGPSDTMQIVRWLPTLNDADMDSIEKALEPGTKLREQIDEECREKNVRLMGSLPVSYRVLTSNIPLETVEDFSKLKVRSIMSGLETEFFKTLGAEATAFTLEKVYLALQQGIVNAQENTIPSIVSNRIYELQNYVTITKHKVYLDQFFVNEDFYQSLSDQEKEWLENAIEESVKFGQRQNTKYITDGLRRLSEEGVVVETFPEEERKKMREITAPVVRESLSEAYGEELVDHVISWVY
ncbi:MAG: TRAP transporter substrate-binding protein [Clostridiales bacterium]|nr:TRAP transporter substrate-binding protein [Clostridiales bacterium]